MSLHIHLQSSHLYCNSSHSTTQVFCEMAYVEYDFFGEIFTTGVYVYVLFVIFFFERYLHMCYYSCIIIFDVHTYLNHKYFEFFSYDERITLYYIQFND